VVVTPGSSGKTGKSFGCFAKQGKLTPRGTLSVELSSVLLTDSILNFCFGRLILDWESHILTATGNFRVEPPTEILLPDGRIQGRVASCAILLAMTRTTGSTSRGVEWGGRPREGLLPSGLLSWLREGCAGNFLDILPLARYQLIHRSPVFLIYTTHTYRTIILPLSVRVGFERL
jgi:hypothetical protein